MSDSLERRIVETLIGSLTAPNHVESQKLNTEILKLVAKYRSRVGDDSWMQRQYNKGLQP